MNVNKRDIGSDLAKVDAHVIRSEEYDEAPEFTDEMFDRAEIRQGERLVRRGRPKAADPKVAVTIRLDRTIVEHFKAAGPGWQSRINATLAADIKAGRS